MTKAYKYPLDKTAILLVDPLKEWFTPGGKIYDMTKDVIEKYNSVENMQRLVEDARSKGVKIFYTLHHAHTGNDYDGWQFRNLVHNTIPQLDACKKDSFGMEIIEEVKPQKGDVIAQEHWTASGFANTDLDMLLKQHGISHLIIAGFRANSCVEATGRYAIELGYHATLISDAIAAFSDEEMNATININWPNFGHGVMTTEEFTSQLGR